MAPRFRDRSTGDLLVFIVAGTVCLTVLGSVTTLLIVESLSRGESDTSTATAQISDIINTLVGLLAGFLAGRSDAALTAMKQPDHSQEP